MRSSDGWVLIITGIHEDMDSSDLFEELRDFGKINEFHVNLDRRTGYAKGYGLVQYDTFMEANLAKQTINTDGMVFCGMTLKASWCFVNKSK